MDSNYTQEQIAQFLQGLNYLSWRAKELASELARMQEAAARLLEELKKVPPDALAPTKKT